MKETLKQGREKKGKAKIAELIRRAIRAFTKSPKVRQKHSKRTFKEMVRGWDRKRR